MMNSLEAWLDAATHALSEQETKLSIFYENEIYSEYWVQNELATLLPWAQTGVYVVDKGPPLVLPEGVNKYPDFILRFAISPGSPLYLIELKDLLTNPSQNVAKLRNETSVMAKLNREETRERWRNHFGKAARFSELMVTALESAPILYCGLAVGKREHVPSQIDGFKATLRTIGQSFILALYVLEFESHAFAEQTEIEVEPTPQDEESTGATKLGVQLFLKALSAAKRCENEKRQVALDVPLATIADAQAAKQTIQLILEEYNHDNTPICHANPWIWTPRSSGRALTLSGQEYGVEIRFSYSGKLVR
jgi:hypothetical protein